MINNNKSLFGFCILILMLAFSLTVEASNCNYVFDNFDNVIYSNEIFDFQDSGNVSLIENSYLTSSSSSDFGLYYYNNVSINTLNLTIDYNLIYGATPQIYFEDSNTLDSLLFTIGNSGTRFGFLGCSHNLDTNYNISKFNIDQNLTIDINLNTEIATLIYNDSYQFLADISACNIQNIDSVYLTSITNLTKYNSIELFFNNDTNISEKTSCDIYNVLNTCTEDWQLSYSICNTSNQKTILYTDLNSCGTFNDLPIDNGTFESCDYCFPDVVTNFNDNCVYNGTEYSTIKSYSDNNYYNCCVVTNLSSDCPTLYSPYNETSEEFCTNTKNDFDLDLDENIYFIPFADDKVWAKIWLNNTSQNFSCISYVKTLDGLNLKSKDTVQVNPDYKKKEKNIINIASNEYESQEFFLANHGISTIYFTKENLILDGRPYLFGVDCSGNTDKKEIISEKVGYVNFKFFNEPITRLKWATTQTLSFILIFIIMLIAIPMVFWYFKRIKR